MYIEIITPGGKDNIIRRPASDLDMNRFPKHYAAFQNGNGEDFVEGTPIDLWPHVTVSQAETLKFNGVRTVEQLALMADSLVAGFMGGQTIKAKAKEFVDTLESNAPIAELREELDQATFRNDQLQAQLTEMNASIATLTKQLGVQQAETQQLVKVGQPEPVPAAVVEAEEYEEEVEAVEENVLVEDPTTGAAPKRRKKRN